MKSIFWLSLILFFLFIIIITQKSYSNPCMKLDHFETALASVGQHVVWRGLNNDQTTINQVYMDEKGRWSVLRIAPNSNSCLVGQGEYSELVERKYGRKS